MWYRCRLSRAKTIVLGSCLALTCNILSVHLTNINYGLWVLNYELLVILQAIYKNIVWLHLLQTEL